MDIHGQSTDEALRRLGSAKGGLSETEAAARLARFGPNEMTAPREEPASRQFLRELTHLLAIVLWIAAALAFTAGWLDPASGMSTLAVAIVAVIVLNASFSFWQQRRAAQAIAALQELLPARVRVHRDGTVREMDSRELVPGDVIAVAGGDLIPADCRVLQAFGLRVNRATVTGESVPVTMESAVSRETDFRDARNVLLAGTAVVAGDGAAMVFATGEHTEFARIAALAEAVEPELSPLQKEIVHVTRVIAGLSIGLGLVFFAVSQAIGLPLWQSLLFGTGILVANVPEGLLPTVTLALAMAGQRMARCNALVRHLAAVETLGAATVICTDKTGTLTENRMQTRVLCLGGVIYDLSKAPLDDRLVAAHRRFFEACLYCENVSERHSPMGDEALGDPMEVALVSLARRALPGMPALDRLDEVPFDAERRRLATLYQLSSGYIVYAKGALEALLPACSQVLVDMDGQPQRRLLGAPEAAGLLQTERELAGRGLRVLAVANRELAEPVPHERLEEDLTLLGLVALEDPLRPEVAEAVRRCRRAGIRVIMVTGDHPATALAVAEAAGLSEPDRCGVFTGAELARMSDPELGMLLDLPGVVLARTGAADKQRVVALLRHRGEIVAVTGDGVNDAPALRAADIGIAMGRKGTQVAREASDIVLADDNFASIVTAVAEGRAAYANIRRFLTYILTSNVPEIVPYIAFALARIPLPLTIMQILAVDLGTDILPALALGAERPHPRVMDRPPRNRRERLLSPGLLLRSYAWLGLFEAAAGMTAFFFVLQQGGWVYGQAEPPADLLYRQATTSCLAAIVAMQVVNVFLCRSERRSLRETGLGGNPLLLAGIAVEMGLMLLIAYTGFGQSIFGTAPLVFDALLVAAPIAALMLLAEELRKAVVRRLG